VFNDVTRSLSGGQSSENQGLGLFVISRKALPAFLTYPLLTFYVSIIYVLATLFRKGLVPITWATYINDAPDPDDVLMLCETINLYRLKERLVEEEELFFLLKDILRSPEFLKAISGDTIRTLAK